MSGKAAHLNAFLRFLCVGAFFSLVFAGTTAGLIRFADTPPLPTSVVVYLCCIPLAYTAQRRFAFRAAQSGATPLFGYAATQILSLTAVSAFTSRFVTESFLKNTLLYLAMAGCAAVISYLICRFIIFRPGPE